MPDTLYDTGEHAPLGDQVHRVRTRLPVLFYAFIATWVMILVLALGVVVWSVRINSNTDAIAQSICSQVYYLDRVAENAESGPTPANAVELRDLTTDLRTLVNCDPPGVHTGVSDSGIEGQKVP